MKRLHLSSPETNTLPWRWCSELDASETLWHLLECVQRDQQTLSPGNQQEQQSDYLNLMTLQLFVTFQDQHQHLCVGDPLWDFCFIVYCTLFWKCTCVWYVISCSHVLQNDVFCVERYISAHDRLYQWSWLESSGPTPSLWTCSSSNTESHQVEQKLINEPFKAGQPHLGPELGTAGPNQS